MPNVRKTPKRARAACPVCGRDVAFTRPFAASMPDSWTFDYRKRKSYAPHNNPATGERCAASEGLV